MTFLGLVPLPKHLVYCSLKVWGKLPWAAIMGWDPLFYRGKTPLSLKIHQLKQQLSVRGCFSVEQPQKEQAAC